MSGFRSRDGFLLADVSIPYKDREDFESLQLVVDTGALITVISPAITDFLGYSAADAFTLSKLDGAAGESHGYSIHVPKVMCLGHEVENFVIACHDIDSRLGIIGLLGMNFLDHFRMDLDFKTGDVFRISIRK